MKTWLTEERLKILENKWIFLVKGDKINAESKVQCKDCNEVVSKRNGKLLEGMDKMPSRGCLSCHKKYQKSDEFKQQRREIGNKYAEKYRVLGKERMDKLYKENPEAKGRLTAHFKNPEILKKSNEGKRKFWDSLSQEEILKRSENGRAKANLPEFCKKRGESNKQWYKENPVLRKKRSSGMVNFVRTEEGKQFFREQALKNRPFSYSSRTSKAEQQMFEIIKNMCPDAENGKFFNIDGKNWQADVFVPSKNVAIEYNGLYWHSEEKKGKDYHLEKMLAFESQGIRVIQIFEHEWKTRQKQCLDFISSALGLNTKIYARKTEIREVSNEEAGAFLQENHIQGKLSAHNTLFKVGLFYNNELVALATFGKHHRNGRDWVLNRFCCKHQVTVVGGLSKLSSYISKLLKTDIVSWADRRLSQARGYLASGWEVDEVLPPDYFYTNGLEIVAKQARMKSKMGTPSDITEYEHALLDGFIRVWDCGKVRLVYRYRKE